jgi:predicted amidohydrolase
VECVGSGHKKLLLLTGGRVVDPANRLDALADVLISAGKIAAVGTQAAAKAAPGVERLEVKGLACSLPIARELPHSLRSSGKSENT